MANYEVKALTNSGTSVRTTVVAETKMEALDIIKRQNQYPLSIQETSGKDLSKVRFSKKPNAKDLAVFCRQFYTMLNAGISIIKCLDILRLQLDNRKLREAVTNVYEDVQKGQILSVAMKKHSVFPDLMTQMVAAGESSGTLDTLLERMAVQYEKDNKINNKIHTAMIYPIILCVLAIAVVILLLTAVMPTFIGLFQSSGIQLPWPTRVVLGASNGLRSYWYIFLIIIAALIYVIKRLLGNENSRYKLHRLSLRLPIVNKSIRIIYSARFARTLGTLLASGISLIPALDGAASVVGNLVVVREIKKVVEEIREGVSLSDLLHKTLLFPPMLVSMVRIGEESGSLENILDKTANFYDEEAEVSLQKLVSMLEPVFILIMAALIGFIVIAILMPVFDLSKTV
ncbi:type II secretion system F family protein [Dehalobacter sp. DCM]|uniref:type II secretion system F family protein n=1 Tax=Dehalobacter sp. DCM TaxID=2907827 RepID=UPI0030813055|nr:type II secretion system F family protein [Dehalobacter sp. DCM]